MESLACMNCQNSANLNETPETQTVFDFQDWNMEDNKMVSFPLVQLSCIRSH